MGDTFSEIQSADLHTPPSSAEKTDLFGDTPSTPAPKTKERQEQNIPHMQEVVQTELEKMLDFQNRSKEWVKYIKEAITVFNNQTVDRDRKLSINPNYDQILQNPDSKEYKDLIVEYCRQRILELIGEQGNRATTQSMNTNLYGPETQAVTQAEQKARENPNDVQAQEEVKDRKEARDRSRRDTIKILQDYIPEPTVTHSIPNNASPEQQEETQLNNLMVAASQMSPEQQKVLVERMNRTTGRSEDQIRLAILDAKRIDQQTQLDKAVFSKARMSNYVAIMQDQSLTDEQKLTAFQYQYLKDINADKDLREMWANLETTNDQVQELQKTVMEAYSQQYLEIPVGYGDVETRLLPDGSLLISNYKPAPTYHYDFIVYPNGRMNMLKNGTKVLDTPRYMNRQEYLERLDDHETKEVLRELCLPDYLFEPDRWKDRKIILEKLVGWNELKINDEDRLGDGDKDLIRNFVYFFCGTTNATQQTELGKQQVLNHLQDLCIILNKSSPIDGERLFELKELIFQKFGANPKPPPGWSFDQMKQIASGETTSQLDDSPPPVVG